MSPSLKEQLPEGLAPELREIADEVWTAGAKEPAARLHALAANLSTPDQLLALAAKGMSQEERDRIRAGPVGLAAFVAFKAAEDRGNSKDVALQEAIAAVLATLLPELPE